MQIRFSFLSFFKNFVIWKCADMTCLLGVNVPTWFPIIIHLLFIIIILSICFYWIKLLLMFTFWCFACWFLILHKHIYSLLGQFYSYDGDERVGGGIWWWSCLEVRVLFILFLFDCVHSFWAAKDVWPKYPDTAIASPVPDMTSESTAFARSLTLKFEF